MANSENATMSFNCPEEKCKNCFQATIFEQDKNEIDYGWWILKCNKCGNVFDLYVGRDLNDSILIYGGEIIARFNTKIHTMHDVKNFTLTQLVVKEQTI